MGGFGNIIIDRDSFKRESIITICNKLINIFGLHFLRRKYLIEDYCETVLFSPSFSGLIMDGKVIKFCVFVQILDRDNIFMGIKFFNKSSNDIKKIINDYGLRYGEELKKIGYFGSYGLDFIISSSGKIYVVEANIRKTYSHYIINLFKRIQFDFDLFFFTKCYLFSMF